jgi:hypothetical protein
MPTAVRVAVIVMSVLAGLLLLYSGVIWLNREQVIDYLVEDGSITRADALRFLLVQLTPFVVLGLLLAASAWYLLRRQAWARWVGLAAVVIIFLLTLRSVIVGGAATILTVLLAVLSMAAITSLLSRTTAAWVPRLRGGDPSASSPNQT